MLWIETPLTRSCGCPISARCRGSPRARYPRRGGRFDVRDTIATRPLELGADFVLHSLTKYIGGHGDALGGAVIGAKADIQALNLESVVHYGGVLSPFNAWLILRGAATLRSA